MTKDMRKERDSLGEIEVPADRYYGAQTARSLAVFPQGGDRFPGSLVHAMGRIKQVCAATNARLGALPMDLAALIVEASQELARGDLDQHIVAPVWQSGSGTQLNMNVNEVIAGRANELAGAGRGGRAPVHPNDHVNRSQSSNDVIPTAMHLAAALEVRDRLSPALTRLEEVLGERASVFGDVVTTGRTHLMDALPVTYGQQLNVWRDLVASGRRHLVEAAADLDSVPLGGTAVGTGVGTPAGFASTAVSSLARETGLPLVAAGNPPLFQSAHPTLLSVSSRLRDLATGLHKIAEDVRLLASGPRCGLGELVLPTNVPGSSAMPGKTNPTQAESLAMVCLQVMAGDVACAQAAAAGHLQLNTCRPLLALNLLKGLRLMAESVDAFTRHAVVGLEVDRDRIAAQVDRSLMLVTALVPRLGYDRAAAIAARAHRDDLTLREAAIADGAIDGETFDSLVRPSALAHGQASPEESKRRKKD